MEVVVIPMFPMIRIVARVGALSCLAALTGGCAEDDEGTIDEDPAFVVECVDVQDASLFPLTKVKGDWEFNGNGPDTDVTVTITRTPTTVTVQSCVRMAETVQDWSTGHACSSQTVTIANIGLAEDNFFEVKYIDTDHNWDDAIAEAYYLDDSPVVTGVLCAGDTTGGDIGSFCGSGPPECSACVLSLGCVHVEIPLP